MTIDIYIREKSGTREIRIPLLPEQLKFHSGDATSIEYDIMELGPVSVPSGTELDGYVWESAFPGENRKNDSMIRGTWQHPKTYDSILRDWKKNGTELNLLVTGYPINADVYLAEYHPTAAGAFGDIHYEIGFIEARKIVVTTTQVEQTTTRPATASSTYTIKSGDTLWSIALMYYGTGTKWTDIYEANKDIIESTAKKYGKSSSENGHWIYPGVTLTIPGTDSSTPSSTSKPAATATATATTAATTPAVVQQEEQYEEKRGVTIESYVVTLGPNKNVVQQLK